MNKYIFTAIALAAVAVGCTKSNIVDLPQASQTPISFETYTGKTPTTKASSETTETLKTYTAEATPAFHVKAFTPGVYTGKLPMNKKVYWDTTEEKWDYEGAAYWPANGKLEFVAYGSNAVDHITFDSTGEGENQVDSHIAFTYEVDETVSQQEDLIVAVPETTSSMPEGGKITLNFKHLLSRVGFKLQTTKTNDVIVTIKSIKLYGDFYSQGTVDLTAPTPVIELVAGSLKDDDDNAYYSLFDTEYTLGQDSGSYDCFRTSSVPSEGTGIYANTSVTLANDGETVISIQDASEADRYMMLIPGGTVEYAEIVYQLPGSSEQRVKAELDDSITLGAGLAYEFVIRLSTDSIDFRGDVVDWDEPVDKPIPPQE